MPSGLTVPSRTGLDRSLAPMIKLSCSDAMSTCLSLPCLTRLQAHQNNAEEEVEGSTLTPEEYLAIPYVLVVESVEGPDGQWFRRAMYPELGISGEALSPLDAIAKLEEARVTTILSKLERGEPVPVPRPPLREEIGGLDAQKLGFAKWLVDQKRVAEE